MSVNECAKFMYMERTSAPFPGDVVKRNFSRLSPSHDPINN